MSTTIENKVSILADLWMNYRDDENFTDFVEYNDLGLPLAYCVENKIVEMSPMALSFIQETFRMLLDALDCDEDLGYEDLEDLLAYE